MTRLTASMGLRGCPLDERIDIIRELQLLLESRGVVCTTSDVFSAIHNVATAASHSVIMQMAPPPAGAMGPAGAPGMTGADGKDAWDKYRWDPNTETMVKSSWKGIEFKFPLATCFVEGFPDGELNYGDINYISTIYGTSVIQTMAIFWRRAYDYHEDMQLFINEEDSCRLQSINESNSYPDPLKD